MIVIFLFMIVVHLIVCLPAWVFARKRLGASPWSLFIQVPSIGLWVALTALGIGAQSLANVTEVMYLAGGAILLYYVKVFILDKVNVKPALNTAIMTVMLCLIATLLRAFMPSLPE